MVPEAALDPMRVHYLEIPRLGLRALVRRFPLFRNLYSSKPLGAVVSDDGSETTFRVFSLGPWEFCSTCTEGWTTRPVRRCAWWRWRETGTGCGRPPIRGTSTAPGTTSRFTVPADPGNWFYETHPVHVSDPYALVNDDALGKSRVWRDGPPPPPVAGGRPPMEDVVAYEVHVQDFTDLLPVADTATGTLNAMARTGLLNAHGEPVGFDHIADLGVNVVHLMPVQEYLHYPDADWQAAFADDPFARAMGIDRENYQWGYRTTHSFAVESRYRSRDAEPGRAGPIQGNSLARSRARHRGHHRCRAEPHRREHGPPAPAPELQRPGPALLLPHRRGTSSTSVRSGTR